MPLFRRRRVTPDFVVTASAHVLAGTPTSVESLAPQGPYAVDFTDDGETGTFYALDMRREPPLLDTMHIYSAAKITDADVPAKVELVWTADGNRALLLIAGRAHAVVDFGPRIARCRSNHPPPDPALGVTRLEWDEAAVHELLG
jgi:hypothetical protein